MGNVVGNVVENVVGKITFQSSLKTKMVGAFLLASVIPILIVASLLYSQADRYLKENLFSYLDGLSAMKRQGLIMQVRNRTLQIETGAQSLRILHALSRLQNAAGEDKDVAIGDLREGLDKILANGSAFEEVYVINTAGKVLMSTNHANEGHDVNDMDYVAQGSRETYLQSFFLSPVTSRLSLVAASPIKQRDGTLLGILAGRVNLDELYKILSDVTGLGVTGESYIGSQGHGEAVFLTSPRHDPRHAWNQRIKFGEAVETPLQHAVQGQNGSGIATDYRGHTVMASWSYMPDTQWGLVTKIDLAEFELPMKKWRAYVCSLSLVLIIVVGVVAYLFAVRIIRPIKMLTSVVERMSKGEANLKIGMTSDDEIGNLAKSFERMLAALKFFQEEKRDA